MPSRREMPSAMALNSTARCDIDLSPGTWAVPCKGLGSGLITVASLVDMGMLLR